MSAEQPQQQQPELRIPGAGRSAAQVPGSSTSHLQLHGARFRSMGVDCEILTLGVDLTAQGQERVMELDRCWSRFQEQSDLSQLNERAGSRVEISRDLQILLKYSIAGYVDSGGLFDPFMGRVIEGLGYDQDFDSLNSTQSDQPEAEQMDRVRPLLSRTDSNEVVDALGRFGVPVSMADGTGAVCIQSGFALDSGGLGKGLGAQLVANDLVDQGAAGVLVNLGGDVAVAGRYPDQGWRVGVAEDIPGVEPLTVTLRSGSVCSSGTLKRVWLHQGRAVHHLLDPTKGEPVVGEFVAASAIAETGWQAEVLTKVALVGGSGAINSMLEKWPQSHVMAWAGSGGMKQFSAATL